MEGVEMNIIEKVIVVLSLLVMTGCAVQPNEVGIEMQPHELSSAEKKMMTSANVLSVGVAASNLNSVINGGVVVYDFEGASGVTRTDVTDDMRNDIPWLFRISGFKTKRYLLMKKYISTTEKECHYEGGWMITSGMQLCMDFIWQKQIDNGNYQRSTWSGFNNEN